jgi:hypothetical protein
MTDIVLITHRNTTVVVPETNVGRKWLEDNIVGSPYGHVVTIQADMTDEFIKVLIKAGIEYEEK